MLEILLRQFCDENDAYTFEEDYCAKDGCIDHCIGISFAKEQSYMEILMKLTDFLDSHDCDDALGELLNPELEEDAEQMVIFFPFICH